MHLTRFTMRKRPWILIAAGATLLLSASAASAGPMLTEYTAISDLSSNTVTFTVNFAGPISPASAFALNSVVGFIDLDTDRNAATGGTAAFGGSVPGGDSWINFFVNQGSLPGPTINLGDEFFIDIGSEQFHPGLVDVVDSGTNVATGEAPIAFGPDAFTITVSTALLPGARPDFTYGIVVGTVNEPTDRGPKGSQPAEALVVPEPSSLTLFGVGGVMAAGLAWRRRKAAA
jgi:PEP-CTERM motif